MLRKAQGVKKLHHRGKGERGIPRCTDGRSLKACPGREYFVTGQSTGIMGLHHNVYLQISFNL
jgi:hypothetical protein